MYFNTYTSLINEWSIDTNYLFLNHGSFGACPINIIEKQQYYKLELEKQPLRFMVRLLPELIEKSKQKLADFINTSNKNIVFVRNATTGVNTILNSLNLTHEHEVIITNHIYPACKIAINYFAEKKGFVVREAEIPFPIKNEDTIIEKIAEKISSKTRLIIVDHIASPTALLFPVEKIINHFQQQGIDCLVDGAHAPGSIPLNIEKLGAAYYTGNCHKWLCSPKGSAFLYVRPDKQENIHPLVISLTEGKGKSFEERFYWTGTEDPTPYICVGEAIDFMERLLPGGWPELMLKNHDLAIEAKNLLCKSLSMAHPCPDSMIANLVSIPLPDTKSPIPVKFNQLDILQEILFLKFNTELFITYWPKHPNRLFRISPQLYNSLEQYDILSGYLKNLL